MYSSRFLTMDNSITEENEISVDIQKQEAVMQGLSDNMKSLVNQNEFSTVIQKQDDAIQRLSVDVQNLIKQIHNKDQQLISWKTISCIIFCMLVINSMFIIFYQYWSQSQ